MSFDGELNKPGNYEGINMTTFDEAWGVSKLDGEGRCVCNTQLFHPGEFLDNKCDECGKPIFPGKQVRLV